MIVLSLLHALEGYTHDNWIYKDISVNFSRLYFVIDGEAYYEENGQKHRFKKNHLYLTPVKKTFSLYDNPQNKMLHTFSHVITMPAVAEFTEIDIVPNTPLYDAVMLYRKYIHADYSVLIPVIQFVLSCIDVNSAKSNSLAVKIKEHIDNLPTFELDMNLLCDALGYTRDHTTRVFLDEYHITPKQYFFAKRMNNGLSSLLKGKSVTETADDLCYSSPYAFSKAFKQHFGLSPENYIKTIQPFQKSHS
jgi:AraC-like DNA-binding protein